jgi:hypothetical protein
LRPTWTRESDLLRTPRAGLQLDRQEPHHSFGHDLIGEYWSREL